MYYQQVERDQDEGVSGMSASKMRDTHVVKMILLVSKKV